MNVELIKHKGIRSGAWYKGNFVISAKDGVWLYDKNRFFSNPELITDGDFGSHYKNESDIFDIVASDCDYLAYYARVFQFGLIDMNNKSVYPFTGHSGYYGSDMIEFSPNNKYLAASTENYTYVYNVSTHSLMKEIDECLIGCWSKRDSFLILSEECFEEPDKLMDRIIFYDPETDQIKHSIELKDAGGPIGWVRVAGDLILVGLETGVVIWMDYQTCEKIGEIKRYAHHMRVSPDQKHFVMWDYEKPPIIYSLLTFKEVSSLNKIVHDIRFADNNKQVALVGEHEVAFIETNRLIK